MNIELNNLIEWTAGEERWMNNRIELIFEIRYWIEYFWKNIELNNLIEWIAGVER